MIENGMNTSITGRAITKVSSHWRQWTFVIMHSISTRKWMIIPMAAVPECWCRQNRFTFMRRLQTVRQKAKSCISDSSGQVFNQAMARNVAQEEDLVFFVDTMRGNWWACSGNRHRLRIYRSHVLTGELPAMALSWQASAQAPQPLHFSLSIE